MERSSAKGKKLTQTIPESDRELFGWLLVISKDRKVDLKELFTYELSSIPQAISNSDGSLSKTNEAQTLRDLEADVQATDHEHLMQIVNKSETAVFEDHMACVQKLTSRGGMSTFGDLFNERTNFVRLAFREGNTVHIVSDKYDALNSIKAGECQRCGNIAGSPEVVVHSVKQVLSRNIKAFLANPKNKDNLNNFIFSEWENTMPHKIGESQVLVPVVGGFQDHERVVAISRNHVEVVEEVHSNHEEADTRLILHIQCSIERFGTRCAIVWSPHTDVKILGVYFSHELGIDIWFRTGTKENVCYIPLHEISANLGQELTATLLAFHAITGCDSTSCFKGRGKKRSSLVLKSSAEEFQNLRNLGDQFLLTAELIDTCEQFTCRLYQPDSDINDINILRYMIFC